MGLELGVGAWGQRAERVLPREAIALLGHEEAAQLRHELRLREKVRPAAHLGGEEVDEPQCLLAHLVGVGVGVGVGGRVRVRVRVRVSSQGQGQ